MTSEQWERIEAVFEAALDQPPAQREAWLAESCPDLEVRHEVTQLLDASEKGADFLDAPAKLFAADLIASTDEQSVPDRIGPYRPVRELGRGGMGAVFLADRSDGHFEHQVALKVLGRQFPSDHLRRRFVAERQILATLNHPGIARLLDGGIEDDRVLYFAMEYVDGRPIDQYCREEGVPLHARLRLFLQACEAVTYAHRNLVVHRDLKPSNILVENGPTADPGGARVKLLDFGIAKLLDTGDNPAAVPLTVTGLNLMTPEYASPEQLRGETVTTASDVYQLGVMLYGLLTGRRLYDFAGKSITEIARVVTSEDVPRPSASVDPEAGFQASADHLRRQLKGDLDAIVGKALRKEPEARYDSVDRFAEDIRRYLEQRPVSARSGTVMYRTRKYVRRHRWVALAVFVAVLAVAGYAVSITAQQARTERERDRAEQYAAFLQELFESPNPFADTPGDREITVREFFDRAVDRVRGELDGDLEMRASLLKTIAGVYKALNYDQRAYELYREVHAITVDLYGEPSEQSLEIDRQIAWLTGDPETADSLYRRQLALARRLEGRTGPITALSLIPYGSNLQQEGRLDEAERTLMEAVAVLEEEQPEYEDELAGALFFLGQIRRTLGRLAAADTVLKQAYSIRAGTLGEEHPRVAILMTELGMVAEGLGNMNDAERWKRKALEIFEASLGPDHKYTVASMNNVAVMLDAQGKLEEAEGMMRRVLEAREKAFGPNSPESIGSLQNLAVIVMREGRYEEAEPMFAEVRRRYAGALPPDHYMHAFPLLSLTQLYLEQGRPAQAEEVAQSALDHLGSTLPPDHPYIAVAESRLGETLMKQRRFAEAERLIVGAYEVLRDLDTFEERKQNAYRRLVDLYDAWGRPEEAERYLPSPAAAAETVATSSG